MRLRFIGQPLAEFGEPCADWLESVLSDERIRELEIATAWLRRSGLARLKASLDAFRSSGTASLLVGIDFGGTTRQGLEESLTCFDVVRVYHVPGNRTFHPKVYLAHGPSTAYLLVGSNNLTLGGISNNYEAALVGELDLDEQQDRLLFDEIRRWFARLCSDQDACIALALDRINELADDPSYGLGDEDAEPSRAWAPLYEGESEDAPGSSFFGQSELLLHDLGTGNSQVKEQPPAPQSGSESRTKTLTRNDLGLTGSHQAGPLMPLAWADFFPPLNALEHNPRVTITVRAQETGKTEEWEFIYYNGRTLGLDTRNECRITRTNAYFQAVGAVPGDRLRLTRTGARTYTAEIFK
jgi:hypothetical protein